MGLRELKSELKKQDKETLIKHISELYKKYKSVKEYNSIVNRIKLNEQLNQKLEETAQAIYKKWFVDFEFPNKQGKPYKSFRIIVPDEI